MPKTAAGPSFYAEQIASTLTPGAPRPPDVERRRSFVAEKLAALEGRAVDLGQRPHQIETSRAIARHVGAGATSGYAVLPTAGGKTRVFVDQIASLHRSEVYRLNTVLLVPTRPLIRQAMHDLAQRHPDVRASFVASRPILAPGGGELPRGFGPLTIMTYHRFMRMADAGDIRPEDVDLMIMDEAHRGLSDLRQDVILRFGRHAVLLGFTATPSFDDEKTLRVMFGSDNEIVNIPHRRLRDAGVLAPVVNYVMAIRIHNLPDGRSERRRILRNKAQVDMVLDFIAGRIDEETGIALRDKLTLFYGKDRGHARMFAAEYNARFADTGKRCAVLTGEDPDWLIERTTRMAAEGEIDAIANAMLLTEGYDLPKIGLIVNSQTGSMLKNVQQSGRGLRTDPSLHVDDPAQTAYVLDTYFEIDGRYDRRARFFFESVDDPLLFSPRRVFADPVQASDVDVSDYVSDPYYAPSPETDDGDRASESADGEPTPTAQAALPATALPVATGRRRTDRPSPKISELDIRAEIHHLVRLLKNDAAPPMTEEWTSRADLYAVHGFSRSNRSLSEFLDGAERETRRLATARPALEFSVAHEGLEIATAIRRKGSAGKVVFAVEDIPKLARITDSTTSKRTKEWLTPFEIYPRMTEWAKSYYESMAEEYLARRRAGMPTLVARTWLSNGGARVQGPQVEFRMKLCATQRGDVVCLHRDDAEHFIRVSGLPIRASAKPAEYLFPEEVSLALGRPGGILSALQRIQDVYAEEERFRPSGQTLVCDGRVFAVRRVRRGGRPVLVYHPDSVGVVGQLAAEFAPDRSIRGDAFADAVALEDLDCSSAPQGALGNLIVKATQALRDYGSPTTLRLGTAETPLGWGPKGLKRKVPKIPDDRRGAVVAFLAAMDPAIAAETDGPWLEFEDVVRELRMSCGPRGRCHDLWNRIATLAAQGKAPSGDRPVRHRWSPRLGLRLHHSELDWIASEIALPLGASRRTLPGTDPSWLEAEKVADVLGIGPDHPGLLASFSAIEGDLLAGRTPKLGESHVLVRLALIEGEVKVCLDRSELRRVAGHLGIEVRNDSGGESGWRTKREVATRLGIRPTSQLFETEWARLENSGSVDATGRLHESAIGALNVALGRPADPPQKTKRHLLLSEIERLPAYRHRISALIAFWHATIESGELGRAAATADAGMAMVRHPNRDIQIWTVDRSSLGRFEAAFDAWSGPHP